MVLTAAHDYATSTSYSLINPTSEPETQLAPIIINILLGPLVTVELGTDEPDIQFKEILMSGVYKDQGQSDKQKSAAGS